MILLDTNVISEPMRPSPGQRVVEWIDTQAIETLYISAVALAELRAGVAMLPNGKRKASLNTSLEDTVLPLFTGRILPFDESVTPHYADIIRLAKTRGFAISMADAQIAAIAKTHDLLVATRDVNPFQAVNVGVINPWVDE